MACADGAAGHGAGAPDIRVEVAFSPGPRQVWLKTLRLPAGSTVRQAVDASGVWAETGLDAANVRVGVWGRVAGWTHALRDHDRVELYRPLKADPKESRRLRYKKQRPAKRHGR